MNINIYIQPINMASALIEKLLVEEFGTNLNAAKHLSTSIAKPHFDQLKDSLFLVAETYYVDKVYRDSFYFYYSSKHNNLNKNCIRISLFSEEPLLNHFQSENGKKILQNIFMGFVVIRPTEPSIIGRSVISPKALKFNSFLCCVSEVRTTSNSIKLMVEGFPHSSQDTETITCAETTLWEIMEYFSNKYPEYAPVLPSKISSVLNKVTIERQVPSKGLIISNISYALREFGFGTRLYSHNSYGHDFMNMLSCYVESGIPLIVGIDNSHIKQGNIGHAVLCIGHEVITPSQIDSIPEMVITDKNHIDEIIKRKIKLFDWDDIPKKFIFIDDNFPVYQQATLLEPVKHYPKEWENCLIKHFVVPLYPKIYLEAFEAKGYILDFLLKGYEPLAVNSNMLIRFFIASSRSYKDWLSSNSSFQIEVKGNILEIALPKFIWVCELSTKNLVKSNNANGLIILDATEPNLFNNKPLVLAWYQDKLIINDKKSSKIARKALTSQSFLIYDKNLNKF